MPVIAYGIGSTSLRLLLDRAIRYRINYGVEIELTGFAIAKRNLELRKLWRLVAQQLDGEQVAIVLIRG